MSAITEKQAEYLRSLMAGIRNADALTAANLLGELAEGFGPVRKHIRKTLACGNVADAIADGHEEAAAAALRVWQVLCEQLLLSDAEIAKLSSVQASAWIREANRGMRAVIGIRFANSFNYEMPAAAALLPLNEKMIAAV